MADDGKNAGRLDRRQFLLRAGAAVGGALVASAGLSACGSDDDTGGSDADAGGGGAGGSGGGGGRRNILLITVDQMRTLELMPGAVALPAIESLLARGHHFTGHHIASAVCTPARSVLYTGQHVPHTKMTDNINFAFIQDMDPGVKTLGHMLRSAGYATAYKGKWHLSHVDPPQSDPNCARMGPTTEALEPYGFADYNDCGDEHGKMLSGATTDADTADAAIAWLQTKAPALDRPFFLAVNFVNPHDIMFFDTDGLGPRGNTQRSDTMIPMTPAPARAPYDTEREVRLPATLGASLDGRPGGHSEHMATYNAVFGEIPGDREDMWRAYLSYYMNCQVDVDAQIQRVLDALAAAGRTEDTIVVFVADHGELGGAHGLRQKGPFIHRENTNVPFVIVHPDHPGGRVVPALMSAVDLAPTLCAFAGLSEAALKAEFPGVVGHSYAGLLDTPDAPGPRAQTGILFTYDGLSTVDSSFAIANASPFGNTPGSECAQGALDLDKRGFVRAVCDGEHRLARWFSPRGFNTPPDVDALRRDNDVELLRAGHGAESDTPLDLDAPENAVVLESLRARLEALIAAEIGADGYVIPPLEFC